MSLHDTTCTDEVAVELRPSSHARSSRYTTMKVSPAARRKLGLIAEMRDMPLCHVLEEMADEMWARLVREHALPE